MLRFAPALAVLVLLGPVVFGLLATVLPAFGYLPALGGFELTFAHFATLLEFLGLRRSVLLSLVTGLGTTAIAFCIVVLFVSGWYCTRVFSRVQHIISPLLSVLHAAAAFGRAFLIAPSGFIMRMISPELSGLAAPRTGLF